MKILALEMQNAKLLKLMMVRVAAVAGSFLRIFRFPHALSAFSASLSFSLCTSVIVYDAGRSYAIAELRRTS